MRLLSERGLFRIPQACVRAFTFLRQFVPRSPDACSMEVSKLAAHDADAKTLSLERQSRQWEL